MIRLFIIAVLLTGLGFKIAAAPIESNGENTICALNGSAFVIHESYWKERISRVPANDVLCRPPLFIHPLTPPRKGK